MPLPLDRVHDFPSLVDYLRDELDWPIPEDISLDEATYDVSPEEIGLKTEAVGGGIEIKQLRPLTRAQPWGVFFLNLPNAKLPVTLVRNILGKLAVRKRASANAGERAAFAKHDLLFIAATGTVGERRLAFAHFADDSGHGDAATLKVLGWDADDTPRRYALTENALKTRLHWPEDVAKTDAWRAQWSSAFSQTPGQVVRDSKAMAKALAALARRIRARAGELIAAQTADGSLVKLHAAFKEALIHDLTPAGFADTYAQTIAYGLLSTAISRASGALTQDDMTANVAGTSPFLKEMLGQFIEAGGKKAGKAALDFDELGVGEVVDLLRDADMDAVLADFDRKNPDEDPVIHFYELFLKEYDAEQKVKRGVFYTPRPVVGFIVRSVDQVLRTEFHLADGLASTATWGDVIAASAVRGDEKPIMLPAGAALTDPFVRILDPATGTGTFLVECVDLIHKTMLAKWQAEKRKPAEIKALWNAYVPDNLLPRLTGFELMMAPYAIAHVKLGLKLSDTGYTFGSDARAQIYLTNALEPAQDLDMQLAFMSEALAHEARAANEAKGTRFTVVLGNPPYSGNSSNRGQWIEELINTYRFVDGAPLGEVKVWLRDDYVKFIRLSQFTCQKSGIGICALITNNSFVEGLTHRGMRQSLANEFGHIKVLDLHGDSKINKHGPEVRDENVFEIMQGVAVSIMVKLGGQTTQCVEVIDLIGPFEAKMNHLRTASLPMVGGEVLSGPMYFFRQRAAALPEYETYLSVRVAMPLGGLGFQTHRDPFVTDIDRTALDARLKYYFDKSNTDSDVEKVLEISDYRGFQVGAYRRKNSYNAAALIRYQSRPLDYRYVYYQPDIVQEWQIRVHGPMLTSNVGLNLVRQTKAAEWRHVMVANTPTPAVFIEIKDGSSQFPLWLKPQDTDTRSLPNIAPAFANRVAALTGLAWDDCVEGPKQGALAGVIAPKPTQTAMFATRRERGELGHSFGPRDLFDWIYAVLHSPAYRSRYADYLKSDFARVPLPGSAALFEALVPIGTDLVATHLLDAEHRFGPDKLPILADPKGIRLAGSGEARVTQPPSFDAATGRVYINPSRWFETVPEVAWSFHIGGYQPAQKWLKDRAAKKSGKKANPGRVLTAEDILHYRRIILALTRTAELMPKIDKIIDAHGGWPGAFKGMTD